MISFRCFLCRKNSHALPSTIFVRGLVLINLPDKTLEGELANEEIGGLLEPADPMESNSCGGGSGGASSLLQQQVLTCGQPLRQVVCGVLSLLLICGLFAWSVPWLGIIICLGLAMYP